MLAIQHWANDGNTALGHYWPNAGQMLVIQHWPNAGPMLAIQHWPIAAPMSKGGIGPLLAAIIGPLPPTALAQCWANAALLPGLCL
jgi:hypothetical protein